MLQAARIFTISLRSSSDEAGGGAGVIAIASFGRPITSPRWGEVDFRVQRESRVRGDRPYRLIPLTLAHFVRSTSPHWGEVFLRNDETNFFKARFRQ